MRRFLIFPSFLIIIIATFPIGPILENNFLLKEFNGKNNNNFDSILVLGGDEKRILRAASLWTLNKNATIIFAGGSGSILKINDNKNEKDVFNYLANSLINAKKTIVLNHSRNTIENLKSFKNYNQNLNYRNTVVVSSPYHYKRIMAVSKKLELNLIPYYWQSNKYQKFTYAYEDVNLINNIVVFNRFFNEIIGILALNILKL